MKKIYISLSIFLICVVSLFSLGVAKPKAVTYDGVISPVNEYFLLSLKGYDGKNHNSSVYLFDVNNEIEVTYSNNKISFFASGRPSVTIRYNAPLIGVYYKPFTEQEKQGIYLYIFELQSLKPKETQFKQIYETRYIVSDNTKLNIKIQTSLISVIGLNNSINEINESTINKLYAEAFQDNGTLLYDFAYFNGYDLGFKDGEKKGAGVDLDDYILKTDGTQWFTALLKGFDTFFNIHLGPVTIGTLFLIPISISLVWFIIRLFRGGTGD